MPQSNLLDESIDMAACHVICCVLAPVSVFLCPTGDFLRGPHELNGGINWMGSAAFRDEEALICCMLQSYRTHTQTGAGMQSSLSAMKLVYLLNHHRV